MLVVHHQSKLINAFPNDEFELFEIERVSRRQFQFDEYSRKFSQSVENTVEKGEIARYEQFLLSPVFSKDLYCRHVKTRA